MNKSLIDDFRNHLIDRGISPGSVKAYLLPVSRFLEHVGNTRLDRISEETTRAFFARIKNKSTQRAAASAIARFLKFTAERSVVPVKGRGVIESPRLPAIGTPKEIALREAWEIERQSEQREADENLIARLTRQMVNHYVYFKKRAKGIPDSPDEIYRYIAELEELIQGNLELFMELSAKGLNVHAIINERVQRQ